MLTKKTTVRVRRRSRLRRSAEIFCKPNFFHESLCVCVSNLIILSLRTHDVKLRIREILHFSKRKDITRGQRAASCDVRRKGKRFRWCWLKRKKKKKEKKKKKKNVREENVLRSKNDHSNWLKLINIRNVRTVLYK